MWYLSYRTFRALLGCSSALQLQKFAPFNPRLATFSILETTVPVLTTNQPKTPCDPKHTTCPIRQGQCRPLRSRGLACVSGSVLEQGGQAMSWLKSCTPGKKKKKKSYSTSQKNVLHSGNEISWDGWKYSPLLPTSVAIFTAFTISHGEPPSSFFPGFIYHHLKPELQRVSANCYCKEQTAPCL